MVMINFLTGLRVRRPILLITRRINDRIGLHSVLLSLLIAIMMIFSVQLVMNIDDFSFKKGCQIAKARENGREE